MLVKIDERFKQDLEFIKEFLIEFQPISIILYGSYGRDEGSWILDNIGKYVPYNDYDILMIIKNKIPKEIIKSIRQNIACKIGIRWIDIDQKTPNELKSLRTLIYNYDLKYASKVIYGDDKIRDLIPEMDSTKIPLKDVEILFFTRIWTFLGALNKKGTNVKIYGEDSRFFRNQMGKAILAIVDVLLIQKGQYNSSYKERYNRLKKYFQHKKELIELANWALNEKLIPTAPDMTSDEIKVLYDKVYYQYFNEMFNALSKYHNRKIENSRNLEFIYRWGFSSLFRRIGWLLLKRNFQREKQIAMNIAQLYIATSYNYGNTNSLYLKKGINSLKRINKTIPNNLTWDEARCMVAEMRLAG